MFWHFVYAGFNEIIFLFHVMFKMEYFVISGDLTMVTLAQSIYCQLENFCVRHNFNNVYFNFFFAIKWKYIEGMTFQELVKRVRLWRLNFITLWAYSADDKLMDLFYFSREIDLTFHTNCLLRWHFVWNARAYFLEKINKKFQNQHENIPI